MYITEENNPRLPYLRDKTSKLTTSPGCYIMKDKTGKIIYIGKAKNLKNRVTSYFRKGQDHLPKVWKMVSNVNDYEFIVTESYCVDIAACDFVKGLSFFLETSDSAYKPFITVEVNEYFQVKPVPDFRKIKRK